MKSIEDYLICPNCGADMKEYSTDELDFSIDNKGHYIFDCWCPTCGIEKRVHMNFQYVVTGLYMED